MLFLISGIIAIWFGFFYLDNEAIVFSYSRSVFYFYSISSIFFVICIIKNIIFNENNIIDNQLILNKIKQFFVFHWLALFLSFLFVSLSGFACKPDFRILPFETNVLSTSQNLYERKISYTTISSIETETGKKTLFNMFIDRNSTFFSYILSLNHSLIGYRPENVFVLNSIIGFLSLFLMYYFIQIIFGRFWGICGLCILTAFPVFILYTNSGSFDIYNLFCSLVLFLNIYCFIKQPNANKAESLLIWFIILLQSQIYSILSIILIISLIVYYLPKKEISNLTYKTCLFPLLLIPILWLLKISLTVQIGQLDSLFNFSYFYNNIIRFFVFLFSGEEELGIILAINIIGFVGFLLFIEEILKKQKEMIKNNLNWMSDKDYRIFWISIFSFYILYAIAEFSYKLTDLTDWSIGRHIIPFLPIIVVMVVYLLSNFNRIKAKRIPELRKSYCFLAILFIIVVYWPNAGRNFGVRNLESYQYFKETRRYLDCYFPDKYNYILLTDNSSLFVPLNYSALGYEDCNRNEEKIISLFKDHTYKYFIEIKKIDMNNDNNNSPKFSLQEKFKEEILHEVQFIDGKLLRFSKLTLI